MHFKVSAWLFITVSANSLHLLYDVQDHNSQIGEHISTSDVRLGDTLKAFEYGI